MNLMIQLRHIAFLGMVATISVGCSGYIVSEFSPHIWIPDDVRWHRNLDTLVTFKATGKNLYMVSDSTSVFAKFPLTTGQKRWTIDTVLTFGNSGFFAKDVLIISQDLADSSLTFSEEFSYEGHDVGTWRYSKTHAFIQTERVSFTAIDGSYEIIPHSKKSEIAQSSMSAVCSHVSSTTTELTFQLIT